MGLESAIQSAMKSSIEDVIRHGVLLGDDLEESFARLGSTTAFIY